MQGGRMRERISVVRQVLTDKVNGVQQYTPQTVQVRIAAEVRAATEGRLERLFASSIQAQATWIVKIHAPLSWQVLHSDRLVWHDDLRGDRTLYVLGVVDPDGRRRELVIAAGEQRP